MIIINIFYSNKYMNNIPEELYSLIFDFVGIINILRLKCVNTSWYKLTITKLHIEHQKYLNKVINYSSLVGEKMHCFDMNNMKISKLDITMHISCYICRNKVFLPIMIDHMIYCRNSFALDHYCNCYSIVCLSCIICFQCKKPVNNTYTYSPLRSSPNPNRNSLKPRYILCYNCPKIVRIPRYQPKIFKSIMNYSNEQIINTICC